MSVKFPLPNANTRVETTMPVVAPVLNPVVDTEAKPNGTAEGGIVPKAEGSALLTGTGTTKPTGSAKPWELKIAAMTTPAPTNDVVAKALLAVMGGLPIEILQEPVRSEVAKLLEKGDNEVGAAKAKLIYDGARTALTQESVKGALHELVTAANDLSFAAVEQKNQGRLHDMGRSGGDRLNFHRTWGMTFLPHDHWALREPEYLVAYNQEAGQMRSNNNGVLGTPSGARQKFLDEWKLNSPTTTPIALADSGSDAVSLVFDIARQTARTRVAEQLPADEKLKLPRAKGGHGFVMPEVEGQVAFFSGSYGGGRGLAAGLSWEEHNRDIAPDFSKNMIESPVSTSRNPTDAAEIARLKPIEQAALAQLEAMCTDMKQPLGAILLEPVLGSKGVLFYRDEFLQQVRALADKHGVPLVFDEVLTCGGRAGSFFYFEQTPVKPDYVTFGKALQVAGIARVERPYGDGHKPWQNAIRNIGITTLEGDSNRMLKASQVMKGVRVDGLLETSRNVGAYFVEQLRTVQQDFGLTVDASGSGMLLGVDPALGTVIGRLGVSTSPEPGARTRLMPPGTLTKDDVDGLIKALRTELTRMQANGQLAGLS